MKCYLPLLRPERMLFARERTGYRDDVASDTTGPLFGLFHYLQHRYNSLMKRTHDTLSPEQTVMALAHFAWCALVALRTAQQDGQAMSPLSTPAFYCAG